MSRRDPSLLCYVIIFAVVLVFPVNMIYCAFPLRLLVFFWRDPSWCPSHNSSESPVAFSQASAGELTRAFLLSSQACFLRVQSYLPCVTPGFQCYTGRLREFKPPPLLNTILRKRYPFCIPSIEKIYFFHMHENTAVTCNCCNCPVL